MDLKGLEKRLERLIEINDRRQERIKKLNHSISKLKSERAVQNEEIENLESDLDDLEEEVEQNSNWITYVTGASVAVGTVIGYLFYLLQFILL